MPVPILRKGESAQLIARVRFVAFRNQNYGSLHGWCVSDMPMQNGMPIYSMSDVERAWGKLVALYKTVLA